MSANEQIKKWLKKQASKGGATTFKRYGSKHMSELVKKRWQKVKIDEKNKAIQQKIS